MVVVVQSKSLTTAQMQGQGMFTSELTAQPTEPAIRVLSQAALEGREKPSVSESSAARQ